MTDDRRIYRHCLWVRMTHWINVVCMTVLLMSGLQIFNAHPALYWGNVSRFDNPLAAIGASPDWAILPAAGDGTPLAFLLCLAVRREWGDLRLPSAVNWPSPPRSRAVTVEPPSDWPLYPAAFAAALPERRGGEAIQCAAEVRLPRRRMRALPAHCSFRPRDFATTRCSLSLAALDLWRAAIGTHDPFRMRPSPYSHS